VTLVSIARSQSNRTDNGFLIAQYPTLYLLDTVQYSLQANLFNRTPSRFLCGKRSATLQLFPHNVQQRQTLLALCPGHSYCVHCSGRWHTRVRLVPCQIGSGRRRSVLPPVHPTHPSRPPTHAMHTCVIQCRQKLYLNLSFGKGTSCIFMSAL